VHFSRFDSRTTAAVRGFPAKAHPPAFAAPKRWNSFHGDCLIADVIGSAAMRFARLMTWHRRLTRMTTCRRRAISVKRFQRFVRCESWRWAFAGTPNCRSGFRESTWNRTTGKAFGSASYAQGCGAAGALLNALSSRGQKFQLVESILSWVDPGRMTRAMVGPDSRYRIQLGKLNLARS